MKDKLMFQWIPFLVAVIFLWTNLIARSATVTAVGIDQNNPSWRTSTKVKPFNDIDNIYGTDGYFLPRFNSPTGGVAFITTTLNGTINTLPSYLTLSAASSGSGIPNSSYGGKLAIDDPQNVSGQDVNTGVAYRSSGVPIDPQPFIVLSIGSGAPAALLRIGILSDTSGGIDRPASFILAQTSGMGTSSATLTGVVPETPQADWYFFDIVDAKEGDKFTLYLSAIASSNKPTISGVTLDINAIKGSGTFIQYQ